jgi:hypothetical protein
LAIAGCATTGGGPIGNDEQPSAAEKQAMTSVGGKEHSRFKRHFAFTESHLQNG